MSVINRYPVEVKPAPRFVGDQIGSALRSLYNLSRQGRSIDICVRTKGSDGMLCMLRVVEFNFDHETPGHIKLVVRPRRSYKYPQNLLTFHFLPEGVGTPNGDCIEELVIGYEERVVSTVIEIDNDHFHLVITRRPGERPHEDFTSKIPVKKAS